MIKRNKQSHSIKHHLLLCCTFRTLNASRGVCTPRGCTPPLLASGGCGGCAGDAFNEIDANKDGVITKEEAKIFFTKVGAPAEVMEKLLNDVWSKEDTDRNGVISFEEWAAVNAPRENNRAPTDENLVATNTANTAAGVRAAGL